MSAFDYIIKRPSPSQKMQDENLEQDMFNQAKAFFLAGHRCATEEWVSPKSYIFLLAPVVVCYAFAIEVYLKLLLQLNNIKVRNTHNILKLCKSLPEDIRNKIVEQYRAVLGKNLDQFLKDIELISEAFEQWRYAYEHQLLAVSTSILRGIGQILHDIILELRPSLKP